MKVMTERELAERLGLSPWTIRKWRLKGGLPHIHVGRRIFYRQEAVEAWMDELERASGMRRDDASIISVA